MLVNDADAVFTHLSGVWLFDVLAFVIDRAGIGMQHAGSNAYQRRLAGTVLTDDGMNLARHDEDIDTLERLHRAEALAQTNKRHHRHLHGERGRRLIYDVMHRAAAVKFGAAPHR